MDEDEYTVERRARRRRGYNLLNQVMRQLDLLPTEAVENIGQIPEDVPVVINIGIEAQFPIGYEPITLQIVRDVNRSGEQGTTDEPEDWDGGG